MKRKTVFARLSVLATAIALMFTLSSFHTIRGSEGYEVYLNNKLVLQQFGKDLTRKASLQLDASAASQELKVIYHHCGQVGKSRQISLRNEAGQTLHTWKFANSSKAGAPMVIKLNDLPAYANAKGALRWSLHYSSSELPSGRQLAVLEKNSSLAARK